MRFQYQTRHLLWIVVACAVALGVLRLANRSYFAGWMSIVIVMGLLWAGIEAGEQTRRAIVSALDRRRAANSDDSWATELGKSVVAYGCGVGVMLAIWACLFFSLFYLHTMPGGWF